jgi:hypothetical protein
MTNFIEITRLNRSSQKALSVSDHQNVETFHYLNSFMGKEKYLVEIFW